MSKQVSEYSRSNQTWAQRSIMGELTERERINGVGPIITWDWYPAALHELKRDDVFVQISPADNDAVFAVITGHKGLNPGARLVYGQFVSGIAYEMIRSAYDDGDIVSIAYSLKGGASYHNARMTYPAMLRAFARVLNMPVEVAEPFMAMFADGVPADLIYWPYGDVSYLKRYRRLGRVEKGADQTFALSICHDWLTDVMMSRSLIGTKLMRGALYSRRRVGSCLQT